MKLIKICKQTGCLHFASSRMACCPTEEKYGYDDSRFEKAVDTHFHCSICYNVLKEPMMCRNNEHIFCRGCITEHLTVNFVVAVSLNI